MSVHVCTIITSSLSLSSSIPNSCRATCLTTLTSNNNTLLIGTDEGAVVRHIRYKSRAVPRVYKLSASDELVGEIYVIHTVHYKHYVLLYVTCTCT